MATSTYLVLGGVVLPVFINEDGNVHDVVVNDNFVNQLSSLPSGTWASSEGTDIFAASGPPFGVFTTTETADTLAIAGNPGFPTASWHSTEATDTFAAAGVVPISGAFIDVTECADSWATTAGSTRLQIETWNLLSDVTAGNSGAKFNTDGPDRIVVVLYANESVVTSPTALTSVSDTAGLTWHFESFAQAGPDPNSTNGRIEVWWAYAHNQLINDTILCTPSSGTMTIFAVAGLNGNYNYPWDPSSFGANSGGFGGTDTDVKFGFQYATGDGLGNPPGIVGLAVTLAWAEPSGFPVIGNYSGGFTTVDQSTPPITRNSVFNVQSLVLPTGVSVASNLHPDTGGNSPNWIVLWNTLLQGFTTPGSFVARETPDGFDGVGHPGAAGIIGDLTTTGSPDIATIFGFERDSGIFVTQENPDTFSAFIFQPLTGSWHSTEGADIMAAVGLGRGENGIWISTEGVDTLTINGYTPNSGTFITTEAADRFNATGAGVIRVRGRRQVFVT